MRKLTKKNLKAILILLPLFSFISMNSKGEIAIKKKWYSTKHYRYDIFDFLKYKVSNVLEDRSTKAYYLKELNTALQDNNIDKAVELAYDIITANQFDGYIELEERSFKQKYRKKFSGFVNKAKSIFKKNKHDEILVINNLNPLIAEVIDSVSSHVMGAVSTGNELFDKQFRQICRYNTVA